MLAPISSITVRSDQRAQGCIQVNGVFLALRWVEEGPLPPYSRRQSDDWKRFAGGSSAHLLPKVCVGAIEELDAGKGAGQLAAAGDPGDGGALVEQVGGLEELDALLLDEAHPQYLALLFIGDQLRGQHLQGRYKAYNEGR